EERIDVLQEHAPQLRDHLRVSAVRLERLCVERDPPIAAEGEPIDLIPGETAPEELHVLRLPHRRETLFAQQRHRTLGHARDFGALPDEAGLTADGGFRQLAESELDV